MKKERGKVQSLETNHESPSMEAVLVLLAIEILAPQPKNLTVVPPKKAANRQIRDVGEDNLGPLRGTSSHVGRRNQG